MSKAASQSSEGLRADIRSGNEEMSIFDAISACKTPETLFELGYAYFWSKGFHALCYVALESPSDTYALLHRGMPEEWMARYEQEALHQHDPIPGLALRHARPSRISQLLAQAGPLTADEDDFLLAFQASGLSDALVFPTFGPFGRSGILGLAVPLTDTAFDDLAIPQAWAIAHQFHTRMSLLDHDAGKVRLSPRERVVLQWLAKGKSVTDIATILGIAVPTVSTHIQRMYGKFDVRDRIACLSKARAGHHI